MKIVFIVFVACVASNSWADSTQLYATLKSTYQRANDPVDFTSLPILDPILYDTNPGAVRNLVEKESLICDTFRRPDQTTPQTDLLIFVKKSEARGPLAPAQYVPGFIVPGGVPSKQNTQKFLGYSPAAILEDNTIWQRQGFEGWVASFVVLHFRKSGNYILVESISYPVDVMPETPQDELYMRPLGIPRYSYCWKQPSL